MNILNKLAGKLFRRKSNSQKKIKLVSNSVKINSTGVALEKAKLDDFSQQEWEARVKELHKALDTAAKNAEEFKGLIESAKIANNDEALIKAISQQIVSACDQISLNGLRLLAGDEIGLKIRDESINIKLPDSAARGFGLSSSMNINQAEKDLEDLTKAIQLSQAEVIRCKEKLQISRQNLKSAGIDLSTVEGLI